MHNAFSTQITKLSATITMLSAGSQTYRAQERVGQSLLLRACVSGTSKREQQLAVAQAPVLVFDLGSTTPFLKDEFQDLQFVITDRVVNGAPVWVAVGGVWFMYRCVAGFVRIGDAGNCTEGKPKGCIYNLKQASGGVAPSDLSSKFWLSDKSSTLSSQYASALRVPGPWVRVPGMHITIVHGLDDGDPTMAAALQQLAAHS